MDLRTNTTKWNSIRWKKVHQVVWKLQRKIYQNSLEKNKTLVEHYQKRLINSNSAKLLAVRKVTQDNRGRNTAGVDGIRLLTGKQRLALAYQIRLNAKSDPIKRVMIPKPGTKELRPLGIPTMKDRAKQALAKMALEPEWEAKFEPNSYGFRPGRGCHDAIAAIYTSINKAPEGKYVLDADIRKCFDTINHDALILKLDTFPQMQAQIRAWLKAGILTDKGFLKPDMGTPQGGVISPLLSNVALHGLELHLKQWVSDLDIRDKNGRAMSKEYKRTSLGVIRYADDFVVLHKDQWVIEQARSQIEAWLDSIGLELKDSKTSVRHTDMSKGEHTGFDFLGFHVRRYGRGKYSRGKLKLPYKTFIKPSKESISNHFVEIDQVLRKYVEAAVIVGKLNPMIRGWCNYFRTFSSKSTYDSCRQRLYHKLFRWACRKHPTRSWKWIYAKYYIRQTSGPLRFGIAENEKSKLDQQYVKPHNSYSIIRHIKVQGSRSIYDGDYAYWGARLSKAPGISSRVSKLLKRQKGRCVLCGIPFSSGDVMEVDHIIPRKKSGLDTYKNLQLLHGHCHDEKSATD